MGSLTCLPKTEDMQEVLVSGFEQPLHLKAPVDGCVSTRFGIVVRKAG